MMQAEELSRRVWDVVVIGAGMGGGTLAYALASAGQSVLVCEQGRSDLGRDRRFKGAYAESLFASPEIPQSKHSEILKESGRWWEEIDDISDGTVRPFIPFVGSGAGGSTALYGMALERFFASDFAPGRNHPAARGAELPEVWPVSFETFLPYYAAAENLYGVRGGGDPPGCEASLGQRLAPPPLSGSSLELFTFLGGKGLHPYQIPLACEHVPGCRGCQGYLCAKNCKQDSWQACLAPAIARHRTQFLDDCRVVRLEASQDTVQRAVCIRRGETIKLEAKVFVLAAGALATPAILLRSTSAHWSHGLANDSGLVGRFLMRHFVDLYAVFARHHTGGNGHAKQLALNDFYVHGGMKLGSLQSFGDMPPPATIVAGLLDDLRHGPLGRATAAVAVAQPALRWIMGRLFGRSTVLASILEDLPYTDNRVALATGSPDGGGDRLAIRYRLHEYDRERIRFFRELVAGALRPYRFMLIKQAENNQRIAHVCGTCRFGDDPSRSVLDANNRAHSVSNLYVVDASFFPSSGGTNPALTIAANALRVAEHLKEAPCLR